MAEATLARAGGARDDARKQIEKVSVEINASKQLLEEADQLP
jgi:hypothetical protein